MVSQGRLAYGILGALAAATATGVAAGGVIVHQRRRAGRTDPPQRFDDLDADRTLIVRTEDGVPLHVEEIGPRDAPLTVVFAHGFTLSMRAFYFQKAALREKFGDSVRMVFFDHRGHGKSGPSVPGSATIDQLGRDLHQLLDQVVPSGPIVLVGHSMGGMTILSLAQQYPQFFLASGSRRRGRPRVRGVALVCTSAGGLAGVSLGLPALITRLRGPLAPLLLKSVRSQAALVERGRRIGRDVAWVITRRFSFASPDVSPDVVDFLNDLISATRIEAIADFYPALMSFDVNPALATLATVDVLIIGGERDVMTPIEHSRALAEALPDAEFIELPDVGHVAILEAPDAVDGPLLDLVARALNP
jgi:pimeloyl-ACP methyl ester carboxylesterase